MSLLNSLPHLCNIQYKTKTKGTLGGSKNAATEVSIRVSCWEQAAAAVEISEYDKRGISVSRKIYFTTDPEVDERYEILITSRDRGKTLIPLADRTVLEVRSQSIPDSSAGRGVLYRVMVEERTGANQ